MIIIIIIFFPHRPLLAKISKTATLSVTKLYTHVDPYLLSCTLIFFERIQITILDLEPNPCFQTFLIISKIYHRIFNCNTSKRRSGQELPFIFFELRAPTCLWGRYESKIENFTLFYIYLLHIHSLSKTFYVSCKELPLGYISSSNC